MIHDKVIRQKMAYLIMASLNCGIFDFKEKLRLRRLSKEVYKEIVNE